MEKPHSNLKYFIQHFYEIKEYNTAPDSRQQSFHTGTAYAVLFPLLAYNFDQFVFLLLMSNFGKRQWYFQQ